MLLSCCNDVIRELFLRFYGSLQRGVSFCPDPRQLSLQDGVPESFFVGKERDFRLEGGLNSPHRFRAGGADLSEIDLFRLCTTKIMFRESKIRISS